MRTIAEDTPYTVAASDLGFSDADLGQTLAGVRIDTAPTNGTLQLNGVTVTAPRVRVGGRPERRTAEVRARRQ